MNTITISVEDENMVAAIRKVLSAMKGVSVLSASTQSIEGGDSSVPEQEVEGYSSAIPADLMQSVAEQAYEDLREKRCMPLDGVVAEIKQSRGWM